MLPKQREAETFLLRSWYVLSMQAGCGASLSLSLPRQRASDQLSPRHCPRRIKVHHAAGDGDRNKLKARLGQTQKIW